MGTVAELVANPNCSSGTLTFWNILEYFANCSIRRRWELPAAHGEEPRAQAVPAVVHSVQNCQLPAPGSTSRADGMG